MSTFHFLSPEWVAAARRIRDEYEDRLPTPPVAIRANVHVTEAPFDESSVLAYVDTSDGALILELGALDDVDLTIRIDYTTAHRLFVDRDQNAAMEAFITGRLVVEGDFTKLLALQGQTVDPIAEEIAIRLSDVTIT